MQLDIYKVLDAYIECALWSSLDHARDDGGDSLEDNYTARDIASETVQDMLAEVGDFLAWCEQDQIDLSPLERGNAPMVMNYSADEMLGHDFWLTRNGHGAGFWDRGLGALGDHLTTMAKSYGESNLYVGDDGRIHNA